MKKATFATLTGGLTAFLVTKGIYIPNDETLILVAFLIVARVLYVKLSTPLANLIDSSIKVKLIFIPARFNQAFVVYIGATR